MWDISIVQTERASLCLFFLLLLSLYLSRETSGKNNLTLMGSHPCEGIHFDVMQFVDVITQQWALASLPCVSHKTRNHVMLLSVDGEVCGLKKH